jgi:hypothetical protein
VRQRKVLEKREIICLVPCYKCVVVYCCPNCGADHECGCQLTPPGPLKTDRKCQETGLGR